MSIEERFNTAVNVIKGLPKNGKNKILYLYHFRRLQKIVIQVKNVY